MDRAGEIDAAAARLVWLRGHDMCDAAALDGARRDVIAWLQRDEVAVAVMLTLLDRKGA